MVTVIPLRLDAFAAKSGTFPTSACPYNARSATSAKEKLLLSEGEKVSEGTGCRRCTGV